MHDKIRLKSAKLARENGLPKIQKVFENIPSFPPVIDPTSTTHYSVGKYLSQLLNSFTHNDYPLKDFFDAATRINSFLNALKMMNTCLFHLMLLHYSQTYRRRKPSMSSLNASTMRSKFQYRYQNVYLKSLFLMLAKKRLFLTTGKCMYCQIE